MAMFKHLIKCVISELILFWHNMTPLLGDVTIKKKKKKRKKSLKYICKEIHVTVNPQV